MVAIESEAIEFFESVTMQYGNSDSSDLVSNFTRIRLIPCDAS